MYTQNYIVIHLQASKRLLLTGTPMQNNLIELMSLLAFVMPDLFTGKTEYMKKIFQSISAVSISHSCSYHTVKKLPDYLDI